jgi:uncharacterized protein (TIGR00730 family)
MDIKVCVFCSSEENISDDYKECSEKIGGLLAKIENITLFTGGSESGLMKGVAHGFLECGKLERIQIVMPTLFRSNLDTQHPKLDRIDNFVWVNNFKEQLAYFEENANHFIILPGGFGTMLEFFHILNLKKFYKNSIQIILFNLNGFFDNLIHFFDKLVNEKTVNEEHRNLFILVDDLNQLKKVFSQ